ncbi:MAG: class I SAM-dependent methyltransferase [Terracidiphilus sp.]
MDYPNNIDDITLEADNHQRSRRGVQDVEAAMPLFDSERWRMMGLPGDDVAIMRKNLESFGGASTADCIDGVCPLCSSAHPSLVLSEACRSLRHCKACNVWWLEPIPTAAELAQYFKMTGPAEGSAAAAKFEVNRHVVLKLVATRLKEIVSGGRILDIGCAVGYFLSTCFLGDKRWEAYGVEVAPQCAERASARGIRMRVGTLTSAGYPDCYFDAVTTLDTFYYFTDPLREIKEIQRILKPGGILAIEAPLANPRLWRTTTRIGRALTRTSRPRLQTDHIFFYTPKALARIVRAFDFDVTAVVPLPANVNTGLVSAIYRTYSTAALLLWKATFGHMLLAPRFLLLAQRRKAE